MFVQVVFFECHACLGHVSSSQLLTVDGCLSLTGVDSATFFGFSPDAAIVSVIFDIEQEVLFFPWVCCHLFWQKLFLCDGVFQWMSVAMR